MLMQLDCTHSCLSISLYVETRSRFSGLFLMCLADSLSLLNLVQSDLVETESSLLHQMECADVLRPLYILAFRIRIGPKAPRPYVQALCAPCNCNQCPHSSLMAIPRHARAIY
jgi:hypothetical protein